MNDPKYLELLRVEGPEFRSYTLPHYVAQEYRVTPNWVHVPENTEMSWAMIAAKLIGRPLANECIIIISDYNPTMGHLSSTKSETRAHDPIDPPAQEETIPEEDLQAACGFLLDEETPKVDVPSVAEEVPQAGPQDPPTSKVTPDVFEGFEHFFEVSLEEQERIVGKHNLVRNTGQLGGWSQSEHEDRILARRAELVSVRPTGEASRTEDVCRVALLGDLVSRRRQPPMSSETPQPKEVVLELLELGSLEGIAYTLSPTTQKWVQHGERRLLPNWTTEGPLAVAIQNLTGFSREKIATLDVRVRVIPSLGT